MKEQPNTNGENPIVRSQTQCQRVRLKIWCLGVLGLLLVVAIQSPIIFAAFKNGFDYSPGKTGLQTTWATLMVLADALILLLWTRRCPMKWPWAILPGGLALVLSVPLAFVALILRSLIRVLF